MILCMSNEIGCVAIRQFLKILDRLYGFFVCSHQGYQSIHNSMLFLIHFLVNILYSKYPCDHRQHAETKPYILSNIFILDNFNKLSLYQIFILDENEKSNFIIRIRGNIGSNILTVIFVIILV